MFETVSDWDGFFFFLLELKIDKQKQLWTRINSPERKCLAAYSPVFSIYTTAIQGCLAAWHQFSSPQSVQFVNVQRKIIANCYCFFFSFFQSVKSMMVPSIDTSFQTCWQFLYGLYSCSVQSPTAVIPYGITSMLMKCKDAMKLQHPCFVWARGESEVLKRKVNCTVSWSPVPSCFLYHSCNQVVGFACVLCFTLEN